MIFCVCFGATFGATSVGVWQVHARVRPPGIVRACMRACKLLVI